MVGKQASVSKEIKSIYNADEGLRTVGIPFLSWLIRIYGTVSGEFEGEGGET